MIVSLRTHRLQSLDQIREFVSSGEDAGFRHTDRTSAYEFCRVTLVRFRYASPGRRDKGTVRSYLAKVTGLSRAQVTRLIGQYRETGRIVDRRGPPGNAFARRFTKADIGLLAEVNVFCRDFLTPYLNFHRPCLFPTEAVDKKGKPRKRYRYKDTMTPFEKLKSLPEVEQHLKPGVAIADLEERARTTSDLEAALALNQARAKLFDLIRRESDPQRRRSA